MLLFHEFRYGDGVFRKQFFARFDDVMIEIFFASPLPDRLARDADFFGDFGIRFALEQERDGVPLA